MKNLTTYSPRTLLISRTDSLGDVVLTLPLCIWLKQRYPTARLLFLGKNYTKELLTLVNEIDDILLWSEMEQLSAAEQLKKIKQYNIDLAIHVLPNQKIAKLLKKADIRYRIGTANRWYHWLTCNITPHFSRKKSILNEAQLNFELVKPLGLTDIPTLKQLTQLCQHIQYPTVTLPPKIEQALSKHCIILHPKSQGNGAEWPIDHYITLANQLIENGYTVIFTGREDEGKTFRKFLPSHPNLYDSSGQLNLTQLLNLIGRAALLVASGTGPLHLAGLFGIKAIGLYPASQTIGPQRWHPLGNNTHIIIGSTENSNQSMNNAQAMHHISPEQVFNKIIQLVIP